MKTRCLLALAALVFAQALSAEVGKAPKKNGFALTKLLIPLDKIRSGGPPRDGIPAIDEPKFIAPDKAVFMKDDDMVLGVTRGKKSRAYPFRILIRYDKESRQAAATADDGAELPVVTAYWFAWQAFYPKTGLWKP